MLGERIIPTKDSVSSGRRNNGETVPCGGINIIPHRSRIQGGQMTTVTGNFSSKCTAEGNMVIHNSSDNVTKDKATPHNTTWMMPVCHVINTI
jgi:hypothetical protein